MPEQLDELLRENVDGSIYLVGAGGCGMSALGHLLLDLGYKIGGSDLEISTDAAQLIDRGAIITTGHSADHLRGQEPFLLVYSSAIRTDNPELEFARRQNLPVVRRATLLAVLMRRQQGVCVAGMHGKTTTAAMLAFALHELKQTPSYAVGGGIPQLGRHAAFGGDAVISAKARSGFAPIVAEETFFVAEADESDGTLRQFRPRHAIILNLDEDHLDYFAGLEAIREEFQIFAGQTTEKLFYCADEPGLVELFAGRGGAISFGFNPLATYRIELKANRGAATGTPGNSFEVWMEDLCIGRFSIRLMGEKNVSNAGAVVAFLYEAGFNTPEIAGALARFTGASRRQQLLYRDEKVCVYEDYGHHPNEIAATLKAFRELRGSRLVVTFQPHRYSRTQHLLEEFATCFKEADVLWMMEVYGAGETPKAGASSKLLAGAIEANDQPVRLVHDAKELVDRMRSEFQPGDVILFLGAGDITRTAAEFVAGLRESMNAKLESTATQLRERLSADAIVRVKEPLARRTTMRVGGPADLFVEPATENDLAAVLKFADEKSLPLMVLGRGSNLLIREGGIRGIVIHFASSEFSKIEVDGLRLYCGAGARLKHVAIEARNHGIGGLEFLEGIPGNVGGALRMNAGAMGGETFDFVKEVRFMDRSGTVHSVAPSKLEIHYRGCPSLKDSFALGAIFEGRLADRAAIEETMKQSSQKRWDSQPAAMSAGCMFKNLEEIPAGRLVDELGLKGFRVGDAVVSDVHGNFVVNEGNATAKDVIELIERIKMVARDLRGLELHTEVQIVGED